MEKKDSISLAVIKRLPRYYHCLKELSAERIQKVSSNIISERLNITASQVRQDLSNFGGFGQQGYGYDVEYLKEQIAKILGLSKVYNAVIIGGGNIGQALAGYVGFKKEGFNILAVFDLYPERVKVPESIKVFNITELEEFTKENAVDIGIIATNAENAKDAGAAAVKCGIKAVWNFAPIELYLGGKVAVENINMSESLFMLAYKLKNLNETGG